MPVVRSVIPYRKSRRLRHTNPEQHDEDDDLWEPYDESLLAALDAPLVKSEPEPDAVVSSPPTPSDTEPAHIPRPRNAFICFRSAYVKAEKRAAARPGALDQTVMSRGAADVWRSMGEAARLPYVQQAQDEKAEHARMYPNYRYAPGSASGVARKSKKARAVRRAASEESEETVPDVRRYKTNPPAQSRHARKRSPAAAPRPRRKSAASPAIAKALLRLTDEPAPSPSPSPAPSTTIETQTHAAEVESHEPPSKQAAVPELHPELVLSVLKASYDCDRPAQFGFKDGIAPCAIATLQFAPPRTPSPPPAPLADMKALSLDEPARSAPEPWDSWRYAPLELLSDDDDDESGLTFDAPPADFGFFHPWALEDASALARRTFADDALFVS